MSGPVAIWMQAADNFGRHYDAVGDDQWGASTPCSEWTVRELADHAIGAQAGLGAMFGAQADPSEGWPAVRAAIETALSDPTSLEGTLSGGPFDGAPKHMALGIAISDLLLHSWDLARAIGADDTLPPAAVEATMMGLQRLPAEVMRDPSRFGAEIEIADDASPQDKMLAFSGRQP